MRGNFPRSNGGFIGGSHTVKNILVVMLQLCPNHLIFLFYPTKLREYKEKKKLIENVIEEIS